MAHPVLPLRRSPFGFLLVLVVAAAVALLRQWGAPGRAVPPAAAPASPHATAAPAPAPASEAAATRVFGADVGFRSRQRWMEHWEKHGSEFAPLGVHDAGAYLAAAQRLRDGPAGGDVLELARPDGTVSRFDRATGAFLAFDADGTIRTFFRPNDGERYFRRQAQREH